MNELINQIRLIDYQTANFIIKQISGIVDFFLSEEEKSEFILSHNSESNLVSEDRVSYGDWQTPAKLAEKVCKYHLSRFGSPDVVIEPTCGLGAFVIAALNNFHNLTEIHAVEINKLYIKELKFSLLSKALVEPKKQYPDIYLYHADFFEFNFSEIIKKVKHNQKTLAIIGNPPWVTNSVQGKTNSQNVPFKLNSFGLKGIDAITGKSNFDISEYITLSLLKISKEAKGGISLLLKNSVIRNIIYKQSQQPINIGNIEQANIDALTEFHVSVSAACFSAQFSTPSLVCILKDFYTKKYIGEYGWVGKAFVADTKTYGQYSEYDGHSQYEWRSGIKHDCASVLELKKVDDRYVNGLGEDIDIEPDFIYPLLKSSDINSYKSGVFRKYLIVPQHRVGEDITQLEHTYPKVLAYLKKHEKAFLSRKSSIYKNKDRFSIFGVGDYSFKPYKIVVSALYKKIEFKLITPYEGQPVMLDDTCYQLDFDSLEEAECIYTALTSNEITNLLHAVVFMDAKRVVTKSLLMRLDLLKLCQMKGLPLHSTRFKRGEVYQLSLFD